MSTSASVSSTSSQPWIYFLSGALLPTVAYYFLLRRAQEEEEDDDSDEETDESEDGSKDEDLFGIETSGPSSKWSIKDAPYKVSMYR